MPKNYNTKKAVAFFLIVGGIAMVTNGFCESSLSQFLQPKTVGVFGSVFDIAEPDPIQEIKAAANRKEVRNALAKIKQQLQNGQKTLPNASGPLEPAKRKREYLVSAWYTLDHDIAALKKGTRTVLYPKGFSFNVLDYVPFENKYVVINGNSPREIAFVRKNYPREKTVVLATEGVNQALEKLAGYKVFVLTKDLRNALGINATVSVITEALYNNQRYFHISVFPVGPLEDQEPSSTLDISSSQLQKNFNNLEEMQNEKGSTNYLD